MPDGLLPLIVLGLAFLVVGVALIVVGVAEERRYSAKLMVRQDLREWLTEWPPRSFRRTITMGGYVSLAVGVVLLGVSAFMWFRQ